MPTRFRTTYVGCLALSLLVPSLAPADPTPPELLNQHWQLGPYIKGTTDEVRDLINGPLEGMLAKKAERVGAREERKAAVDAKAAEKLRGSSPAFAKLEEQLARAKAARATAQAEGNIVAKMKADSDEQGAEEAVQKQIDAATRSDPAFADDRKALADMQRDVISLDGPISSATVGRARTLDSFRLGQALPGPPTVGAKGMLRQLKSIRVVDAHSFTADYVAIEKLQEIKDPTVADGVKAYSGRGYRVKLLVTDTDTSKLKGRDEMDLDRTYQVKETRTVGRIQELVVVPLPGNPFDALFAVLDDVRTPAAKP